MGSLGCEIVKNKAMWLYPKVMGFNPCERWGHSACSSNGVVYVFGGCCGGLHFSDILMLEFDAMAWTALVTTGQQPGKRDSHSAVLVGHKMIVLGGTNGSKKVNDLHILDLRTKEWSQPTCEGVSPSPRESHTATIVGENKLVVFGGSGEGEANYLNDIHVLDLNTMKWTSPEVKGDLPVPRDSHTAVAIENKLVVYGGDCGDRYHGEVEVLDMGMLTWSKVYVIGGVGDKHYYNDVWVLDLHTCSWTQLDICCHQPQGRFSHSAAVINSSIVIYGGCGEDEHPINELLVLQLGANHPNGRHNISLCKIFSNHCNQEKPRYFREMENSIKKNTNMVFGNGEPNFHAKRRKSVDHKVWAVESEQEEHSLSLSQHSSPTQSDQEQTQTTVCKPSSAASDSIMVSLPFGLFKQQNQTSNQTEQWNSVGRSDQDFHFMGGEFQRQRKPEQRLHVVHSGRQQVQFAPSDQKLPQRSTAPTLIGAEVHGMIDGAFDSGYLMTAKVNGQILRGVLFTPGHSFVTKAVLPKNPSLASPNAIAQPYLRPTHTCTARVTPQQQATIMLPESGYRVHQDQPLSIIRSTPSLPKRSMLSSDLQDVVLTLGGSGSCRGGP
ncbi:uncharacterized protein LOC131231228 isoform X2 [Magnolia sinica]|uniref:uncharacterized protein LOC131231228 isoform X2 n=1 Tax=Magnolia sinica TaxID=86752 RepID=UPI00265B0061|nr:uncharacterized protein LOC131231228 isoform X2 [Magnolia sinica]